MYSIADAQLLNTLNEEEQQLEQEIRHNDRMIRWYESQIGELSIEESKFNEELKAVNRGLNEALTAYKKKIQVLEGLKI